ncbi:MAG TPA: ribosome maturation factor RimP [Propionibacteriaceae bacterium]|nr:ribosome maturation factor RimP [Propionibacteriaceae bacterium]HPZ49318.1 ribosome maturation factor RimP [Propionibacteriaceae bacterium]HQE31283.1 ribosome maturation factor RimP [Propionibacteriaceae bacterium]
MNVSAVTALLVPVLAEHRLELDDLTVVPAGKRSLLRVTVDGDGPLGKGPTLDEIAVATRAISDALDGSTVTGNAPYVLEVSSRGVGKPLARPAHWRRNRGRLVQATTESRTVTGRIVEADDETVTLDVDGTPTSFPYAALSKPTVQIEMNRKPDPDLDDVGEDDDNDETDIDTDDQEN